MSRLEELILTQCPSGVEFKKLGQICNITTGKLNANAMTDDGKYPFFTCAKEVYQIDKYAFDTEALLVSGNGSQVGHIHYYKGKFNAYQRTYVLDNFSENISYIRHILQAFLKQRILEEVNISGVPYIKLKTLSEFLIPIPPLMVQEEIVRILDTFSGVVAELEAEQKARVKQYEHYRNELLSFDSKSKIIEKLLADFCPDEVEYLELQQIFNFRNGYTPSRKDSENWNDGTISWFTLKDLRKNGGILSESIEKIAPKGVKKGLFEANSIIISTLATIGEHAIILNNALANQQMTCLTRKKKYKDLLTPKFVYYYCFLLGEWCRANIHVSGFASVDMVRFAKFKFPIPPLSVQEEIVSILDRFDTLVKDLKSGLPAEIVLRRKQYEYYRDKLLSFEPSE